MTNICTKVTVRKRPIKNGQVSLYLDFYPPIRHPKTGKPTRREYLGIYIYANPSEKFEGEFNKTMLRNAELIKCKRTEAIINEEFGFLDHNRGKESFLEYFRSKMADDDNFRNWNTAYKHFEKIAVAVVRSMTCLWTSAKATSLICSHLPHRTRAR